MCHLDHHRKFPTKIIRCVICLDSDVAGSSKDTQRIHPKPKTQLSSTKRPVCRQESTKRGVLTLEHVEEDQTGTERPVFGGSERGARN